MISKRTVAAIGLAASLAGPSAHAQGLGAEMGRGGVMSPDALGPGAAFPGPTVADAFDIGFDRILSGLPPIVLYAEDYINEHGIPVINPGAGGVVPAPATLAPALCALVLLRRRR